MRQSTALHLRTVHCDKNATETGQDKVLKASAQFGCTNTLFQRLLPILASKHEDVSGFFKYNAIRIS